LTTKLPAKRRPDQAHQLVKAGLAQLPELIVDAGPDVARRFLEFFTAHIRNANTRAAYGRAVGRFLAWCQAQNIGLSQVEPIIVAGCIEQLGQVYAKPTVKQQRSYTGVCWLSPEGSGARVPRARQGKPPC
jgi:integrase/recombinase XerD